MFIVLYNKCESLLHCVKESYKKLKTIKIFIHNISMCIFCLFLLFENEKDKIHIKILWIENCAFSSFILNIIIYIIIYANTENF